jgi:hypothetical protein
MNPNIYLEAGTLSSYFQTDWHIANEAFHAQSLSALMLNLAGGLDSHFGKWRQSDTTLVLLLFGDDADVECASGFRGMLSRIVGKSLWAAAHQAEVALCSPAECQWRWTR